MTAKTAPSRNAAPPGRDLVRAAERKLGKLKLVEPVVLTRESLCATLKLSEADVTRLLCSAHYEVAERASNRHIACLGPYAHATRLWVRGETQIVTTTDKTISWRAYSEHIAFVDARYSGPDCRATQLRAVAQARAAELNAAAATGDLDKLIAVLNARPECSVMPVPYATADGEEMARAA